MIGKILAVGFVCMEMAVGQTASKPAAAAAPAAASSVSTTTATPAPAATAAPTRAYAFDVISIRQNKTPPTLEVLAQAGPTADGFRSHQQPLLLSLITAYVPQVGGAGVYAFNQVKGIPDWLISEPYDIDARISDEDRAEWQNPAMQKVMLRAVLQALLADRCKLAVHREMKDTQVTSLVVAKGGPKLLCLAISCPRSQVNERRRDAGSLRTCLLSAATTVAVSLLGTLISMVKRECRSTRVAI